MCAFDNCRGLKSITFLGSIKVPKICQGCCSLETVTFCSGVKEIDDYAFNLCKALKTIYVPASKGDFYRDKFLFKYNRYRTEYDWAHPDRDWNPVELRTLVVEMPEDNSKK